MSKIIVGVDESGGSADAISLASRLAGITGAELMLVNVYPYDRRPSRTLNHEFEAHLREGSLELLERLRREHAGETIAVKALADPSPAHGLHEAAEAEGAALVVVGSTHTGRAGRVLPGSTAERLLHGAPCPVAVAPKAYAQGSPERGIIGCGYDGSQSAQRALSAAHRVAAATGARLRVLRAFKPLAFDVPPGSVAGGVAYNDDLQERAEAELASAVAGLEGEPPAEPFFAVGDAAKVLAEASEELDLLVVGSRGYGPMRAVMVGGVAGRLVREAACPVIVLPRGAGHAEAESLFARGEEAGAAS